MDKDITAQRRDGQRTWQKFGISGSTLKLIAAACMLADHLAAGVLGRYIAMLGITQNADQMNRQQWEQWRAQTDVFVNVYESMRLAGRIAFPIYCFLLVEGFRHTQKRARHAAGLLVFALISEIPFDLCFYGEIISFRHQNVFFTLFIGLLVIAGLRFAEGKAEWNKGLRAVLVVCMLVAGAGAAELLRTDYGAMGVLTIVIMYLFRKNRVLEAGAGCVMLTAMQLMEISSFFVLIPIRMYNGRRGWNIKWFFYAFYPLHILLLYLIACAMGLGGIRLMR